jgi:fatty-acyl-CoA synthase
MTDIAGDWVAYNAARFPDAPALENAETHEVTSWRQLEGRVSRLAGALIERFGITKGDRVSMLAENDTRVFEVQFACMRLGAIFVPLNWRLAPPELEQQCGDAEPALIVHDEVWQEAAYNLGTGIGVDRYLSWRVRDTPADLDEAIHRASPFAATRNNVMDDPTHILFTSGTTGRPKGALTTFGTLAWQTANIVHTNFLDGPGCKLFNPLPLFHAGGLTTLASPLLRTGACVAVARRFDPEQALSYIGDPARGVTHFGSVPTMWQMMMDIPAFARADFSGFRHSQIAGSSPPEELLMALVERGIVLQQQYGGTELGPNVSSVPRDMVLKKLGSCGIPGPYTQVRLVGADGVDVERGMVGEVYLAGPSVSPGYWGNRHEHLESRVDGWLRTGDAASMDEDGYLTMAGRYKDMYKSGGENVFAAEVETVLLEHPDIVEVAVVGAPDPHWSEVGYAFIVARDGREISLQEVEEHCRPRIARYKTPKRLAIVDSLPRNATGKVIKDDLRRRAADEV